VDNTKELKHLSLCTGYGGIDLGLSRAMRCIRTVCYVEIEAFAIENLVSKIEAETLDLAPVYTDLKTFPFSKFRGCVDILSGGFPCQPFSGAGRKEADEDPRHLFPYILDGIRECRPAVVFLENVEGIINSKLKGDHWNDSEGTPVLLHVLRELERVGYSATAGLYSAEEVGASHRRIRVFILAIRKNLGEDCRLDNRKDGKHRLDTLPRQILDQEQYKGPLSPRWVETLMGLPVGWTMPSCVAPTIIERTNCACLGTESSLQQQNERLGNCGVDWTLNEEENIS
jgi:site-specific DNA-cytosine methylase